MTTENQDGNLSRFRSELSEEDATALFRAKLGVGVRVFLILFVCGYMTWLLGAVSRLDARELTRLAAAQIEEELPVVRTQLRDYAVEIAPDVVDHARDVFVELPAQLRQFLENRLATEADALIARFERDADAAITQVVEDQLDVVRAAHPDSTPEELLDAIVLGVSDSFRRTVTEALDELYIQYALEVERLSDHLDYLRTTDNLTESEKLDKQLIEAWMVLVHEYGVSSAENLIAGL